MMWGNSERKHHHHSPSWLISRLCLWTRTQSLRTDAKADEKWGLGRLPEALKCNLISIPGQTTRLRNVTHPFYLETFTLTVLTTQRNAVFLYLDHKNWTAWKWTSMRLSCSQLRVDADGAVWLWKWYIPLSNCLQWQELCFHSLAPCHSNWIFSIS